MSDYDDPAVTVDSAVDIGGVIITLVVTVFIILVCIICTVVACIMRCSILRRNGQRSFIRPEIQRSLSARYRDEESQPEEENGDVRARDLSQAPPPAYRNANQYQNVDLEHTEVVRMEEAYRISTHMEPETTSLPPDYTSQRLSISVAPQEMPTPEGQLPPTYSTAQLELMARRTATELGTLREENMEIHQTEFHIPSDSQTADSSNVQ